MYVFGFVFLSRTVSEWEALWDVYTDRPEEGKTVFNVGPDLTAAIAATTNHRVSLIRLNNETINYSAVSYVLYQKSIMPSTVSVGILILTFLYGSCSNIR